MSLSLQPTLRFTRHYVEMLVAMFVGMGVLGAPALLALGAAGSGWDQLEADAPSVLFLGMATTMTVPMVALMRFRGHGWLPCAEMTLAMFLPTFAVIGLLAAGAGDFHGLMAWEHVAMPVTMLGAMLLRPSEYACHHRGRA
jgi:hypothetical protein